MRKQFVQLLIGDFQFPNKYENVSNTETDEYLKQGQSPLQKCENLKSQYVALEALTEDLPQVFLSQVMEPNFNCILFLKKTVMDKL